MLRLLPFNAQYCGTSIEITDPLVLDIAEKNLKHLAQTDSCPAELKLLTSDKPIKSNRNIATYSPILGPAGILRSTDRIRRLVDTKFDTKHPILLHARHTVASLLARNLHHEHFHQGLDFMRVVINSKNAILGLRRLLNSTENHSVTL